MADMDYIEVAAYFDFYRCWCGGKGGRGHLGGRLGPRSGAGSYWAVAHRLSITCDVGSER